MLTSPTELKELIALHSTAGQLGGDLQSDTITIIGATLDLQEKVVRQAMTPLDKTFMLNINTKLDFDTMKRIGDTGHSRVAVYEEVEVPVVPTAQVPLQPPSGTTTPTKPAARTGPLPDRVQKVKKIVDVMAETSGDIYREKLTALNKGDESVLRQMGDGKDVMSILC